MTEFKQGDRVRVIFEAEYVRPSINHRVEDHVLNTYEDGCHITVPFTADIELIERKDDPSRDPVGTVRKCDSTEPIVAVKVRPDEWRVVWDCGDRSTRYDDKEVRFRDWEVIGAVPGTPAWEAHEATDAEYCTPMAERPLWTGDGSEEPPAHVTKVKAAQGAVVYRTAGRWAWSEATRRGWVWMPHMRSMGPFTEVRDD